MFDIGAPEFIVLAIAALFIFGPDRLPDVARQAARGLKQLRSVAGNARRQFSQELGPEFEDFRLEDLNPRSFIRRNLMDDVNDDLDLRDDLKVDLNGYDTASAGGSDGERASEPGVTVAEQDRPPPPFDPDAT